MKRVLKNFCKMIVDGRAIAKELEGKLKEEFNSLSKSLRLDIILVGDNAASRQFVNLKQKMAARLGVEMVVHELEADITEDDLEELLNRLSNDERVTGIIIQLPLPSHLAAEKFVNLIPAAKDVDALGSEARVLSPVVGAVKEVLTRGQVEVSGKKIMVLGKGKLVGQPIAIWLTQEGGVVEAADKETKNIPELLKQAEIVVSGIGVSHFIKPEMIKDGVVLIDAGTSESAGQVAGDADPACAAKCSLFTPVPGGVGPITVVKIFENLLKLKD